MFEQIIDIIEKNDSIVIFGHFNPDGDCYGSAIGLKRLINLNYPEKKVYVAGSGLPKFFDYLSPTDTISDEVIKESLCIIVDANDLTRMEDQRARSCKAFCKIDHHVDTGGFTEGPFVVVEEANSTCDILVGLVEEANWKIDSFAADTLYLGIMTDSGRFQFVTNFPETFRRASFLCEHGANPRKLNKILAQVSERSLRSNGYVLSHYKKSEGGVIYIIYPKEVLHELTISANNASNLINLIGNVKGYPIWASFAEYDDGRVRVELRSNGPAVQPIAMKVGGGGHMQAAGASLPKLDYEQIDNIIKDLDDLARSWKEEN